MMTTTSTVTIPPTSRPEADGQQGKFARLSGRGPRTSPSLVRSRWAAVGAAVTIALGAGGVGVLQATSPRDAAAFVPITPCRLFDTRPESQVGSRSAPLGPNDTHTVPARGDVGDCDLPVTARGLVLNVTAVAATAPTFLTFWPGGAERPHASALNPVPDAPPTPNAVTVDLNLAGEFAVYNLAGSVHVLADVAGYYTDHHHDDRYYTKAESDSALAAKSDVGSVKGIHGAFTITGALTDPGSATVYAFTRPPVTLSLVDGQGVLVDSSIALRNLTGQRSFRHAICVRPAAGGQLTPSASMFGWFGLASVTSGLSTSTVLTPGLGDWNIGPCGLRENNSSFDWNNSSSATTLLVIDT